MKQKYVLHPGIVNSAAEGKCFFVSASTLAYLYGIDLKECRIANPFSPALPEVEGIQEIHLYPALEKREGSSILIVTTEHLKDRSLAKAA